MKMSEWRKKNPLMACYQNLKYNAKRRNKQFDLKFEEFKRFAILSKYFVKKGIYKDSYHIDRIDESKGYTADNIQVLTNSENIRKFIDYKGRNEKNKPILKTDTVKSVKYSDVPF